MDVLIKDAVRRTVELRSPEDNERAFRVTLAGLLRDAGLDVVEEMRLELRHMTHDYQCLPGPPAGANDPYAPPPRYVEYGHVDILVRFGGETCLLELKVLVKKPNPRADTQINQYLSAYRARLPTDAERNGVTGYVVWFRRASCPAPSSKEWEKRTGLIARFINEQVLDEDSCSLTKFSSLCEQQAPKKLRETEEEPAPTT